MRRLTALTLLLALCPGCAVGRWSRRHPVVTGLIAGSAAGIVVGLKTRDVVCHYDSQNVGIYPAGHCPKESK